MTIGRRTGAPRLLEWTGERCVPWAPDVQVVYEHMHRYLWATPLVAGRDVLDLASGEGFGAALLARTARSVRGIDIDQRTVDHSSLNYAGDAIRFSVGDARDLSAFADDSFGAVVAFEMIEHVADQARVLNEVARVLAPDGIVIVSTPDRRAYSPGTKSENPFHVRELDLSEFKDLLGERFAHVGVWGQRTVTGSALSSIDDAADPTVATQTLFIEPSGDEWTLASGMSPQYLVAVASNRELPPIAPDSTLSDADLRLLRAAERRHAETIEELNRAGQERERSAVQVLAHEERQRAELQRAIAELQGVVSERDVEIGLRHRRIAELTSEGERDAAAIEGLSAELAEARRQTAVMSQSVTWRAYQRLRERLFAAIGGRGSMPARAIQATLRGVGRIAEGSKRPTAQPAAESGSGWPSVHLPEFDQVRVSLVIPLFRGAQLTLACLQSIVDHPAGSSYEVILVDDEADEDTKALLAQVHGARIVTNESNIGYLRSVKRGAAVARGEWLVLCNNDIEVRDGWLEAMLDCGRSSPDVAVVTPKYMYPDGSLNEAGAIVWSDGTGANYGRGFGPDIFHFQFRREVDYGSAAALLVKTSFWREVGGFDETFLPMYYEDTDLCFQARERGYKVMYEPDANVVHVEGGTAGTDVSSGHKRHQEINRSKFVHKWRGRLAEQSAPGGDLRRAADRGRGPRVLIVDHRVPSWDRDSGSLRLKGMIDLLLELGCRVTLLPDNKQRSLPYSAELQRLGVEVLCGDVNPAAELGAFGSELAIVFLSRPTVAAHWLDLIRDSAPNAFLVYDTVDLHWLRVARKLGLRSDELPHASRATALRELELALIRAADGTLTVTNEERELVNADVPEAKVWVAPNVNIVRSDPPPADGRRGVVFVGGFEHPPNTDAVVRIVRGVMPIVWRTLGRVPVTIVGGSAPREVVELASDQVEIAGWVKDIDPVLDRARVMLAPLAWGAGLKGKVTQALAAGLPVVTTAIGAEGLDATDGRELLIGEDDEALAERVVRALVDDELWRSLSDAGRELVEGICSPDVMRRTLVEILAAARQQGEWEFPDALHQPAGTG